jgi:hypothetical protein
VGRSKVPTTVDWMSFSADTVPRDPLNFSRPGVDGGTRSRQPQTNRGCVSTERYNPVMTFTPLEARMDHVPSPRPDLVLDLANVVVAQVKANLACQRTPILLPDFGSPAGSN